MKYKRLIPLITPILIWLLSQAFLRWPDFFYSALAVGALLIVISVKHLVGSGKKNWLSFIITPVLFFLCFSGYTAIIISHFWIQAIFLLELWFFFSYLRVAYYYINHSGPQWASKLDNLLISGGFLTAFAAAALLFGLPIFLDWPLFIMLFVFTLIISLLLWQFNLLREDGAPAINWLLIIIIIILTELVWAMTFLPLNFNILGLFAAIIYYLGLTMIRLERRGGLNRRALKLPLIFSAVLILVLLLTARWL